MEWLFFTIYSNEVFAVSNFLPSDQAPDSCDVTKGLWISVNSFTVTRPYNY